MELEANDSGSLSNGNSCFPFQSVIASLRSNLTTTGFPLQSGLKSKRIE